MIDPVADPLASGNTGRKPVHRAETGQISDATHPVSGDDLFRSGRAGSGRVRVSRRRLVQLAALLPARDRRILDVVEMLQLVRGDQLRSLFFHELSTQSARSRVCRRTLQRLTDAGLLRPLERRIGGDRAGSSGTVYTLAPAGRRLLAHVSEHGAAPSRSVHEPGLMFVAHTLAIADLYVALVEAERAGEIELLTFEAEPVRTYMSPIGTTISLKPDAYVRLGVGEFEQLSFCELDLGTEGRGALERKLHAYVNLYRGGREHAAHGLFPRVVWITEDPARAKQIASLIDALPASAHKLFTTTVREHAVELLAGRDASVGQGGSR